MAIVKGTNAGFVTSAPTADPEGGDSYTPGYAQAGKFQSPAGDNAITDMGVYISIGEAGMFQLGIYSNDATQHGGDGAPNALLASHGDQARGTDPGWKTGAVSFDSGDGYTASTWYWLAHQEDSAGGNVRSNSASIIDEHFVLKPASALPDSFSTHDWYDNFILAIYAVYAAAGGETDILMQMLAHHGG